ncbi:MAG: DoxX family protein [Phycisphaeraceae bacterium]|nr:DoxX family protein [Phycisphaeraceae bacterium]MCB9847441.1 DoxX family protein [Phycisphaeraceae bacterium]
MTGAALPKPLNITSWIMQSVAAIVFLAMGAFPKLTADPYAVQLFEKVGLGEPGMYATGVAEFLAGVLILIPRTNWMGAALGALIMLGAMGSHLFTKLGMVPKFVNPQTQAVESNPLLFPFAMLLFGLCLGVVALRRLHPASAPAPQTESEPPAEQD